MSRICWRITTRKPPGQQATPTAQSTRGVALRSAGYRFAAQHGSSQRRHDRNSGPPERARRQTRIGAIQRDTVRLWLIRCHLAVTRVKERVRSAHEVLTCRRTWASAWARNASKRSQATAPFRRSVAKRSRKGKTLMECLMSGVGTGGPGPAPAWPVSGPARRGPARDGLPGEQGRGGGCRGHHAYSGKLSCSRSAHYPIRIVSFIGCTVVTR